MPQVNILKKMLNRVWNSCGSDAGKGLIVLGTLGWVFSALAQIVMIARNKDIDKKEKKFLIPQEGADGVINCTLYYTVCAAIKKAGDWLLESCMFLTKDNHKILNCLKSDKELPSRIFVEGMAESLELAGCLKKIKSGNLSKFYEGSIEYLKDKLSFKERNFGKIEFECYKDLNHKQIINQIDNLKDAQRNFKKFKNGVGVLTAVGASVLASNLLTPIARNITANHFQKKLTKDKYKTKQIGTTIPISYRLPVSNTFSNFKI